MSIYEDKIQKYKQDIIKLGEILQRLSTLRLVAFIVPIILIIILASAKLIVLVLVFIVIWLVGFAAVLRRYQRIASEKDNLGFLLEVNEQEILRVNNKLSDFTTGQSFNRRDHAYVSDFDIFGAHSLFQLINRATTESGRVLFAEWLSRPASKNVILERQQAVAELAPKLDWRQDFQAAGMPYQNAAGDYNKLLTWVEEPVILLPDRSKYLTISILLSIASTLAAVYFFYVFSVVSIIPLIVVLYVNSSYLKKIRPVAEEIIDSTQANIQILGGYQSLISKIEGGKFDSQILKQLHAVFNLDEYSAADEIKNLKGILEIFQQKGTRRSIGKNDFYNLFNKFWLFDVHLIILTEKWKVRNRSHLRNWASAVSEFEVLSSLAGFSHANPDYHFPEIEDNAYVIDFERVGHPLLNPATRVYNDFSLTGRGAITMITGSNMAGKSTFQRTIGINLVLALMGAPCCAKSARVSPMKIFTSMRTQDNLEEGVSSFYAELKRIEQLLKLLESGEAIFFLLDEMFKGTNSQDRYKGGASLIKQLNELNAFGIISTHDLELAQLTAKHMAIANFSFNSEIREGEIIFNYKLTEGICKDFNASELMKRSGIKILMMS